MLLCDKFITFDINFLSNYGESITIHTSYRMMTFKKKSYRMMTTVVLTYGVFELSDLKNPVAYDILPPFF
jgi:hypothetical protein